MIYLSRYVQIVATTAGAPGPMYMRRVYMDIYTCGLRTMHQKRLDDVTAGAPQHSHASLMYRSEKYYLCLELIYEARIVGYCDFITECKEL